MNIKKIGVISIIGLALAAVTCSIVLYQVLKKDKKNGTSNDLMLYEREPEVLETPENLETPEI